MDAIAKYAIPAHNYRPKANEFSTIMRPPNYAATDYAVTGEMSLDLAVPPQSRLMVAVSIDLSRAEQTKHFDRSNIMRPSKHNKPEHSYQEHPMLSSITNYYEQLVLDEIFRTSSDAFTEPPDQDLIADIMCLALNRLPARYVRHSIDFSAHLSSGDGRMMRQQVTEAVAQAIATIKRRQSGER
ncbi:Late competence development protein ComFB [Thiorhodovibrio winogradskyi]|uniref:Late competence development protein ComFB n=1 Tax=Thiorhodovibrio winogradskyi TaxID=77007 RepID=A0ABZ0SFB7_9GAMM|nr:late competence development ComFB family protein [Thiorhodovibrio winogradskyi]